MTWIDRVIYLLLGFGLGQLIMLPFVAAMVLRARRHIERTTAVLRGARVVIACMKWPEGLSVMQHARLQRRIDAMDALLIAAEGGLKPTEPA